MIQLEETSGKRLGARFLMSACLEGPTLTHRLLMAGVGRPPWPIEALWGVRPGLYGPFLISDCHADSVWRFLGRVSEHVCAALNHCRHDPTVIRPPCVLTFQLKKLIFCQQSLMEMYRRNELGSVMLLSALKVSYIF